MKGICISQNLTKKQKALDYLVWDILILIFIYTNYQTSKKAYIEIKTPRIRNFRKPHQL